MGHMEIALLIVAVVLAVGAAVGGYLFAVRQSEAEAAARADDQTAATDFFHRDLAAAFHRVWARVHGYDSEAEATLAREIQMHWACWISGDVADQPQ